MGFFGKLLLFGAGAAAAFGVGRWTCKSGPSGGSRSGVRPRPLPLDDPERQMEAYRRLQRTVRQSGRR